MCIRQSADLYSQGGGTWRFLEWRLSELCSSQSNLDKILSSLLITRLSLCTSDVTGDHEHEDGHFLPSSELPHLLQHRIHVHVKWDWLHGWTELSAINCSKVKLIPDCESDEGGDNNYLNSIFIYHHVHSLLDSKNTITYWICIRMSLLDLMICLDSLKYFFCQIFFK